MQDNDLNELAARLIWDIDYRGTTQKSEVDQLVQGDIFLIGVNGKTIKATFISLHDETTTFMNNSSIRKII